MPHAMIHIFLVGTEGQLDKPEEEYEVKHLEDCAFKAAQIIQQLAATGKYKKYGFTIMCAEKILTDEEAANFMRS